MATNLFAFKDFLEFPFYPLDCDIGHGSPAFPSGCGLVRRQSRLVSDANLMLASLLKYRVQNYSCEVVLRSSRSSAVVDERFKFGTEKQLNV